MPRRSALSHGTPLLHGWRKLSAFICTKGRGARTPAMATSVACSSHLRHGSGYTDRRNRRLTIPAIPLFRLRSHRASSFTAPGLSGCTTVGVGAPGAQPDSCARKQKPHPLRSTGRRCSVCDRRHSRFLRLPLHSIKKRVDRVLGFIDVIEHQRLVLANCAVLIVSFDDRCGYCVFGTLVRTQ